MEDFSWGSLRILHENDAGGWRISRGIASFPMEFRVRLTIWQRWNHRCIALDLLFFFKRIHPADSTNFGGRRWFQEPASRDLGGRSFQESSDNPYTLNSKKLEMKLERWRPLPRCHVSGIQLQSAQTTSMNSLRVLRVESWRIPRDANDLP